MYESCVLKSCAFAHFCSSAQKWGVVRFGLSETGNLEVAGDADISELARNQIPGVSWGVEYWSSPFWLDESTHAACQKPEICDPHMSELARNQILGASWGVRYIGAARRLALLMNQTCWSLTETGNLDLVGDPDISELQGTRSLSFLGRQIYCGSPTSGLLLMNQTCWSLSETRNSELVGDRDGKEPNP